MTEVQRRVPWKRSVAAGGAAVVLVCDGFDPEAMVNGGTAPKADCRPRRRSTPAPWPPPISGRPRRSRPATAKGFEDQSSVYTQLQQALDAPGYNQSDTDELNQLEQSYN